MHRHARTAAVVLVATAGVARPVTAQRAPASPPKPLPPGIAAAVDSFARRTMAAGRTAGLAVAVVRGRDTILLRGYGFADLEQRVPVDAETQFRIGSISKQFVAAAVMRLAERGRLAVTDPVTKHVPELPTHGHRVTLHHLLTHTSGLPTTQSDPWNPCSTRTVTNREAIERYRDAPMESATGSRWSYNNFGYVLLAEIVERTSGRPWDEYLREQFFAPLGMRATHVCSERTSRIAKGYERDAFGRLVVRDTGWMNMSMTGPGGGHCSTLRDLLRWQAALVSGRVVRRDSYARMTTPVRLADGSEEPYGYGLAPRPVAGELGISHGGQISGYGSYLSYYPARDLHVVVLVNSRAEPSRPLAEALAQRVLELLNGSRRPSRR